MPHNLSLFCGQKNVLGFLSYISSLVEILFQIRFAKLWPNVSQILDPYNSSIVKFYALKNVNQRI